MEQLKVVLQSENGHRFTSMIVVSHWFRRVSTLYFISFFWFCFNDEQMVQRKSEILDF